jgi:NADH:ubiquinone oxidoreductase subunit 5 (subunit L)/multisubunit Na+/H+ antiporter MnhA subunit
MKNLLTLKIGEQEIEAPSGIPVGGLGEGEAGAKLIQNGLSWLLVTAVILALIFLIWGGIKWITSEGDKTKVTNARKTIIYSLVGMIIAFLSFVIVSLISNNFFGIELLTKQSPSQ